MFGLFSKNKKYIKEYEKQHNISIDSFIKKYIEEDINWYIVREAKPVETDNASLGVLMKEGLKHMSHCVCYSDEDYNKFVNAIITFYAKPYFVKVYRIIEKEKLNVREVDMKCAFFKALFKNNILSNEEIRDIIETYKKPDIIIN